MLDLHVLYDATGSTTLFQPKTIPANDGAVVAGVPLITATKVATLAMWGAVGLSVATGIKQASMTSNDLNDPNNTNNWKPSGTSLNIMTPHFMESLSYATAARVVQAAQKGIGLIFTFQVDHYEPKDARAVCVPGSYFPAARGLYSQLFGGALTAGAWGSQGFAPTYNLPAGRYALLGFQASALTNVAAVRFQHADFGVCQPGCIAADFFTTATTITGVSSDDIAMNSQYNQFVQLSQYTGKPQCPVFRAGPNGTGLNIGVFDLTADTPTIVLNLAFLGP
jgi:hypothetical protein